MKSVKIFFYVEIVYLNVCLLFQDLLEQPVGSSVDKSRFIVAVIIEFIRSLEKLSFSKQAQVIFCLVTLGKQVFCNP